MVSRSKEANAKYQREWYHRNKELQKNRVATRKQAIREWLGEYKSKLFCSQCGQDHPATLDFHHTDKSQKETNIAQAIQRGWSIKRIKEEISKCVVLCANCHRILHWDQSSPKENHW